MKILKPLLARKGVKKDLDKKNFIFEPKMDGVRAILVKNKNRIKLLIRGQKNIMSRFPELLNISKFIDAKTCVLDGEIVVYNKQGLSDYKLLEKRTWPEKMLP